MKNKASALICVLIAAILFSGCEIHIESSKLDDLINNDTVAITCITTEPCTSETAISITLTSEQEIPPKTHASSDNIDVDLTVISSTMVYAEVFNIVGDPYSYLGKRIKVRGTFDAYYWDETDRTYSYVVISDATACCQSGLEFTWDNSDNTYPDGYPNKNQEFEIIGTYQSYVEQGHSYYYIAADELKII